MKIKILESLYDIAVKLPKQETVPYVYVDYLTEDGVLNDTVYKIVIHPNMTEEYQRAVITVYINGVIYETQQLSSDTEFYILRQRNDEQVIIALEGYYETNKFKYHFNTIRYFILPGPICAQTTLCSNGLLCGNIDL